MLYVLDEPTIGLHPRDIPRLVRMLRALRDLGNTVLVIEHDLEMIAAADWVVDFGPGAGRLGGQIVAAGHARRGGPDARRRSPGSTWPDRARSPSPPARRPVDGTGLTIHGAREHNLQDITVRFPLRTLTARHRRLRLGQVLADVRHPRPGRPPALLRRGRPARRARRDRRLGALRQDHHHRPEPDRPLHALERRHLHRRLHPHPRGLRRPARRPRSAA